MLMCDHRYKAKQALIDHENRHLGLSHMNAIFARNDSLQNHCAFHIFNFIRMMCHVNINAQYAPSSLQPNRALKCT